MGHGFQFSFSFIMHHPGIEIEIPCVLVSKSVTVLNEEVSDNSDNCKRFFRSFITNKSVEFQP